MAIQWGALRRAVGEDGRGGPRRKRTARCDNQCALEQYALFLEICFKQCGKQLALRTDCYLNSGIAY